MSTLVEKLDAKLDSLDSAQELAQEVAGHVSSLPLSSGTPAAHSSDLSDLLSKLLYATIATQQPSLQDSARFIESIFESLPGPSEPDSELQASSRASQVADQPPKNHKELLQFAICDILWALDSSFEAAPSSEPWPAPRDAKVSLQELSPHRYALRGLLALLRVRSHLPTLCISHIWPLKLRTSHRDCRHSSRCLSKNSVWHCKSQQTRLQKVA